MLSPEWSLRGKVAVVTGANSGIGRYTALALAHAGAHTLLGCRSTERGEAAAAWMRERAPGAKVQVLPLDLACLASVRAAADQLLSEHAQLHVLLHNAGVVTPRRVATPENFDTQMAVAYWGPFLLTELLRTALVRSAPARIINVASDLHRGAHLDYDDLHHHKRYHFLTSYRRAERAKLLWTADLARQLDGTGVTVNALHPGGVRTRLFRNLRGPVGWLFVLSNLLKKGPAAGARLSVELATAPGLQDKTGLYFSGRRRTPAAPRPHDREEARQLYERSLREVGLAPDSTC